jgi:TolB-like protein
MTARGLLLVASGCTVVGILGAWAIRPFGHVTIPSVRITPVEPVAETPPATGSVLWLLSIGVSRYQDTDFDLQFAAADARAIATALEHQGEGPLYAGMKTLVLTDDDVTRESILGSMERFLSQAGAQDVAVIFMAGHGVQDLATGSYYFLPYPATPQNLVTAGLRMSDFDEMVRTLRRNVRGVVVMLDTCHAGALRMAARGFVSADDLAARMSVGEGSFLLAATKPGEESKEKPELEHGAFTYAVLEGLQGPADADGDGLVSVSEIFSYVARMVPRLTEEQQHPYHKMEGTDLIFAAVPHDAKPVASLPPVVAIAQPAARPTGGAANTIGVMEFRNLRTDPEHDWVGKALRVVFNTELNKVRQLQVYAPELIDRTVKARGSDQLYTAQQLGIGRLVTGSFQVVGDAIRIDARIVNAASGLQEGSDSVEGNLNEFFDLQKKLVLSMLRRLPVQLSPEEGASIETKTNTNVDAYRLMLQAEGVVEEPKPSPSSRVPATGPQSCLGKSIWKYATMWPAAAYAEGLDANVAAEVRQVLEEYRRALERKDLNDMASLYVSFPARQRDALREYLDNAAGLTVEVADVTIAPRGAAVAVSYTRRDQFVDKGSSKPQRLEVRLTKILVREDGKWKIAGGP